MLNKFIRGGETWKQKLTMRKVNQEKKKPNFVSNLNHEMLNLWWIQL